MAFFMLEAGIVDGVMLGNQGIADTGEHIRDGIVYKHCDKPPSVCPVYQLALRTPGIWPL